jgi:clan AA aspartic protease (TIGR02281 family)
MICRNCRTANPESSVYCASCGQPLFRKPIRKRKNVHWYVLIAGLGILLIGAYFIFQMVSHVSSSAMQTQAVATKETAAQTISEDISGLPLILAGIAVNDLEGTKISRWASAVCRGNWAAAPVWSLLGGKDIVFRMAESEEIPVKKGAWATGDPIILLKLQDENTGETQELCAWKQFKPLEWRPYLKGEAGFHVEVPSAVKRGSMLSFPLPSVIKEAGVFMQEGRIVGWAFPGWLDNGYLWGGSAGADLVPDIQMDRFLRETLPSWRESHFAYVLNREMGIPAAIRLEALAEGLRMDSMFSEEDIPERLRLPLVVDHMHSLISELIETGSAAEAARILDESFIVESQNLTLLKDSVYARLEAGDYNKAIQFLERIKKNIMPLRGHEISGMDQFHAKLYKDWLRKILDRGSYFSGMVAFEEAKRQFPEDMELHLLGVEVALKDKNWTRARELLQMRDYPENMRDWVGELENEIQEVQENEGAVKIRFNPGTKHILVKVFLNGSHSFPFIIDTGATISSIPSSAVDKLKIDISQNTPVRLVSTAGGVAETYEVKLRSVELEGFRVFDVEALIIDIPGYREYGLLGQNFLNNFHIEIDNQKGLIRLKKR